MPAVTGDLLFVESNADVMSSLQWRHECEFLSEFVEFLSFNDHVTAAARHCDVNVAHSRVRRVNYRQAGRPAQNCNQSQQASLMIIFSAFELLLFNVMR